MRREPRATLAIVGVLIAGNACHGSVNAASEPKPALVPVAVASATAAASGTPTASAAAIASPTATAAPTAVNAEAPKPTARRTTSPDSKAYAKALSEGRQLHRRKDYVGAIRAFQSALDAKPADANALAELGWAAYLAKQLNLAETSTRAALAATWEPSIRGAALFNLGMIFEDLGKKPEAVKAYADSLASRPNVVVQRRLAKLDPAAAEAARAFRAHALKGPSASWAGFCGSDVNVCVIPGNQDSTDRLLPGPAELKAEPAYLGVNIVGQVEGPYGSYGLAIRTAAGWYVDNLEIATNMAVAGAWSGSAEIESLDYHEVVPGPPREVVLVYTRSSHAGGSSQRDGSYYYWESTARSLLVCGIGSHGVPVCTEPILLGMTYTGDQDSPIDYALDPIFPSDGTVELQHRSGQLTPAGEVDLGKHRIIFP